MAEQEWILINKNDPLDTGDRIRMYYTVIGPTYMVAAQVAAIETKLESDPRFKLIRTSLPKEGGWTRDIWFEILIQKPQQQTPGVQQATITGAIIAVAIAAAVGLAGLFTWLSLKEIRLWIPDPEKVQEVIKETGWTALKIGAAAVVGMIALNWWKK